MTVDDEETPHASWACVSFSTIVDNDEVMRCDVDVRCSSSTTSAKNNTLTDEALEMMTASSHTPSSILRQRNVQTASQRGVVIAPAAWRHHRPRSRKKMRAMRGARCGALALRRASLPTPLASRTSSEFLFAQKDGASVLLTVK